MGSTKHNRFKNRSCDDCLWGDKCKNMDKKPDFPCDDFWESDEDAELNYLIEQNRKEFSGEWQEYSDEWGFGNDDN